MEIRPLIPGDATAVADLLEVLGYPTTPSQAAARVVRVLDDGSNALWVAVDGAGVVLGLTGVHVMWALEYDDPIVRLLALAVRTSAQGRGVGSALLARAEEHARQLGARVLTLNSGDHRHAAHAFYRSRGYDATGLRFRRDL